MSTSLKESCLDISSSQVSNISESHDLYARCNTLQHTATYCTTLYRTVSLHHTAPPCTTLHHIAPNCTTLPAHIRIQGVVYGQSTRHFSLKLGLMNPDAPTSPVSVSGILCVCVVSLSLFPSHTHTQDP